MFWKSIFIGRLICLQDDNTGNDLLIMNYLFPYLLWDIFQWLLALFGHMNMCTLQPDVWPCPWRFCCSYCTFVRQSCPVIHKTNSSYCYRQIKPAEQNRLWCLTHTHMPTHTNTHTHTLSLSLSLSLYKEWIYWYTSQSVFAHTICLYAHISNLLSFLLYHIVTLHWNDVFALTMLTNILYTGNFMRRCNNFSCGQGWCSWYNNSLLGLNPAGTKVFCFIYIYIYIYTT